MSCTARIGRGRWVKCRKSQFIDGFVRSQSHRRFRSSGLESFGNAGAPAHSLLDPKDPDNLFGMGRKLPKD